MKSKDPEIFAVPRAEFEGVLRKLLRQNYEGSGPAPKKRSKQKAHKHKKPH